MKRIKVGEISLPETIKLKCSNQIARLTFYPKNGRWNAMYIWHNKTDGTFDKFNIDVVDFSTIEECAFSLHGGLKNSGYIKK